MSSRIDIIDTVQKKYILVGLDCANCAEKINKKINELQEVKQANVNFVSRELNVEIDKKLNDPQKLIADLVSSIEPGVKVVAKESYKKQGDEHSHSHTHDHDHTSTRRDKIEIGISVILLLGGILFSKFFPQSAGFNVIFICQVAVFVAAYLFAGHEVVLTALRNIKKGEIFDENFLMTLATVGAFAIGEFGEAVAVMLFYRVGEMLQSIAVNNSRKSIASLMDIRPDSANLKTAEGMVSVSPEEVKIGDIIVVRAGERIPLDGVIISGTTSIDTAALTGESAPMDAVAGDNVLSGSVNINGYIEIEVTKEYGDSTVQKILTLVEEAESKKAKTENFITKFARIYTPAVVGAAVIISVIVPLVFGLPFSEWVYRGLVFLVVSCPCALVVSIPLSYFSGIGRASKAGILVKGGNYLDALTRVRTVVFDKTGTLTKGSFAVEKIVTDGVTDKELARVAAYAEHYSTHPIATAIKSYYQEEINQSKISDYSEIAGEGICVKVDGQEVLAGNARLLKKYGIGAPDFDKTHIHIAVEKQYKGSIIVADQIKSGSHGIVGKLKKLGVQRTVMLSGDSNTSAQAVAHELGLDEVYAQLLPQDKTSRLEQLENELPKGNTLVFVGDGINDAPVLARADVGIAMGGVGSDSAIEAADVVIMNDDPQKIATAITIATKTRRIVMQNIVFSLGVKLIVQILGLFGIATMWAAVFADVGVTVIAVLNSIRILRMKD